jgi:glyoxylase-like metal-dependent hydrolase (beta-lactamase superfamily II)
MKPSRAIGVAVSAALLLVLGTMPRAQVTTARAGNEPLDVVQLRPNFHVIAGAGGNIAVQTGPNGALLVDTGRADAAGRVLAAIQKITDQPISLIVNTSPDGDYVGGNALVGKAGRNIFGAAPGEHTAIFASEKVLLRMSAPTGQVSPFPAETWPTDTFAEPRKDLYFNKEGVQIIQVPAGHSDAASIVFFRASDVVVTGRVLDATRFPVIDVAKGGSVQGEIDGLNRVIDLAIRPVPFVFDGGGTSIVPGRGRVYDKIDVVEYRDMMVVVRDVVEDMIKRGMTLAQVKAAAPAKPYERQYGASSGPWTTDDFVEAVYQNLSARK